MWLCLRAAHLRFNSLAIGFLRNAEKAMRLLLAPNSFKECAQSCVVAELMRRECAKRGIDARVLPLSDGGDGFVRACAAVLPLQLTSQTIRRCYDDKATAAEFAWDPISRTRYLESANIIGLKNVPQMARDPLHLNTENLGRLLHACRHTSHVVIGVGGTATNDLGLGLCRPFGLRLFDARGSELDIEPAQYPSVARIVLPTRAPYIIDAVLDVRIPLAGRIGTAHVFARQKGATDQDVLVLEQGTKNILRILRLQHGIDLRRRMVGAGGGLCIGLSLISPLRIIRSRDFMYRTLHLKEAVASSDVIVTGEGRFDAQSLLEKATGVLVGEALRQRKEIIVVTGRVDTTVKKKVKSKLLSFIELTAMFGTDEAAMRHFKKGISHAMQEILSIYC
jgi:glycerate kinase